MNVGISLGQCRFVLGHLKIHQWKMKYDEETWIELSIVITSQRYFLILHAKEEDEWSFT